MPDDPKTRRREYRKSYQQKYRSTSFTSMEEARAAYEKQRNNPRSRINAAFETFRALFGHTNLTAKGIGERIVAEGIRPISAKKVQQMYKRYCAAFDQPRSLRERRAMVIDRVRNLRFHERSQLKPLLKILLEKHSLFARPVLKWRRVSLRTIRIDELICGVRILDPLLENSLSHLSLCASEVKKIDFLIVWQKPQNRFFIFPKSYMLRLLRKRRLASVKLPISRHRLHDLGLIPYLNAWHLLKQEKAAP